jgi:predicted GNAT family acetyltransferase
MSEPKPMPLERPPLHVRDVPERSRYEAALGDDPTLAGLLAYQLSDGTVTLIKTEVQDGFEGRGIGSRLVRGVFDDARARGLKVVPVCAFVVRWLERHPDQADIVIDAPERGPRKDPQPA